MQAVVVQQGFEIAQVCPEVVGWNGRILPSCPSWLVKADSGEPRTIRADFPQSRSLARIGDDPSVQASAGGNQLSGSRSYLGLVVPSQLDEHPAVAARQVRHRASGTRNHVDDSASEPLAGDRGERQ